MPDRDSVINDLNVAKLTLCNPQMLTPEMCIRIGQAITSALAMLKEQQQLIWELQDQVEYLTDKLKEQEAVKPVLDEQTGRMWLCGKCGSYVGFEDNDPYDPNEFDKYCRECGKPVLWEGR